MSIYQFDPEDAYRFANFIGIKVKRSGDELVFSRCPFCGEQTKDRNKFAINLRTGQYNCFRASCGAKGNMITLSQAFNFELPGYADEYYNNRKRYLNISRFERPKTTDPAIEYLRGRGISEEIVRKYEITTAKDNPGLILFPFYDENNTLQLVKYRNTKATKENGLSKEFTLKKGELGCKPILFGMNHCDPEKEGGVLIMTEGQIDSLSVAEAGFQNVVSVPMGCNGFTWVPYCWNFLQRFKELVIFGDYEHGRITLLDDMQKYFNGLVTYVDPADYKDCKDANEILQKYGKDQIIECLTDPAAVGNKNFIRLSEIRSTPISEMTQVTTGIDALNKTLGGFYFGQLIILTGERGEGKSTLANQFALTAVARGIKTLIYSGELPNGSLRDWIDHQAAGPDNLVAKKNIYGDTYWELADGCADRIAKWYSNDLWIYQNQFTDDESDEDQDVIDLVRDATRQGFQMIIIDNLMTAMDDDVRVDLYRAQTKFVKQLVRIAKARNVIIVLIAHQRKNQGTNRTADDVSGSANITNLADVVMTFRKPQKTADVSQNHDREIQIQKNRLTGKLGNAIPVWFDRGSRRISDKQGDFSLPDVNWDGSGKKAMEFDYLTPEIDNPFAEVL